MTENSARATQNGCSFIPFAPTMLCVGLGPQANSTPMSVSSDNSAHWGGSERRYGLMTTSMTWVRDPRSTFELPISEETQDRAARLGAIRLRITAKIALLNFGLARKAPERD